MHNPESIQENVTHKILSEIQTDHQISARPYNNLQKKKKKKKKKPKKQNNKKQKRNCRIVDFAVPADHKVELKKSEKRDKYLGLERELKKLWNMKVTVIPIVIGALGTVTE